MEMNSQMVATQASRNSVFKRVLPPAIAIIPVSMLFGVLASRADWSPLEVALISLLGFSGSGQFALLPLVESKAGFITMLIITASINSRYLPIAYMSTARLPKARLKKALWAHMLGDEAYATEKEQDNPADIFIIRSTIFVFWFLAALAGAVIGGLIPSDWISADLNLGYPASVVLMYLTLMQLRFRVRESNRSLIPVLTVFGLCAAIAALLIHFIGFVYFWIPSILITAIIIMKSDL